MFTTKSREIADACRFCWMCRHVCPVGRATGNEAYTPRGRGLVVSMDARGREYSREDVTVAYNCCLCEACSNNCATGYDPLVFIREARSIAVAEGWAPQVVNGLVDSLMDGSWQYEEADSEFDDLRSSHLQPADVLVVGCGYTKSNLSLLRLLEKNHIPWMMLEQEPDSGAVLADVIGYLDEVQEAAVRFAEAVNASGATKIVVTDPSVVRFIHEKFAQWEITLQAEVLTSVAYIAAEIEKGAVAKPEKIREGVFTYHDPCRLARGLDDVTSARAIISYAGVEFKEMFLHGKEARCCGGPVLWNTNPGVAAEIADTRWEDAVRAGADIMITACPCCLEKLSRQQPEDKAILDVFELLM